MQKFALVFLVIPIFSCAPGLIPFATKESAFELPLEVDNGDRFADPQLVETEKPVGVEANNTDAIDSDSSAFTSGSPEEQIQHINQRILNNAEFVIKKEASKRGIGDACNFFLQRVLQLSGFSDAGFTSNDFDHYAKKHFTGFKTAQFRVEPLRKDAQKLHQFLYSYPEGTPFILQWERSEGHGHLAIVTVKGGQLLLYEAALGRSKAKKKQTDTRTILSASDRYKMVVYVNFMPSDK